MQTKPTHFVTFHFGWQPTRDNIQLMHVVIRQIMRQWQRKLGLVILAWSRLDEVGTAGDQVLHIHCLLTMTNGRLPYALMVAEATRISGAVYPVRIEDIKSESQATWYVTKYATKGLRTWYRHARPWYTSQPSPAGEWRYEQIDWTIPTNEIPPKLVGEAVDEATGEVGTSYIGPAYITGRSFYPCFIREQPRNGPENSGLEVVK